MKSIIVVIAVLIFTPSFSRADRLNDLPYTSVKDLAFYVYCAKSFPLGERSEARQREAGGGKGFQFVILIKNIGSKAIKVATQGEMHSMQFRGNALDLTYLCPQFLGMDIKPSCSEFGVVELLPNEVTRLPLAQTLIEIDKKPAVFAVTYRVDEALASLGVWVGEVEVQVPSPES